MYVTTQSFAHKAKEPTSTTAPKAAELTSKFTTPSAKVNTEFYSETFLEQLRETQKDLQGDKSQKEVSEEHVAGQMASALINADKLAANSARTDWDTTSSMNRSSQKNMVNESAQFKFSKNMKQLEGQAAEKMIAEKTMDKKGHLFNPALAQKNAEQPAQAGFSENALKASGEEKANPSQSSSTDFTPKQEQIQIGSKKNAASGFDMNRGAGQQFTQPSQTKAANNVTKPSLDINNLNKVAESQPKVQGAIAAKGSVKPTVSEGAGLNQMKFEAAGDAKKADSPKQANQAERFRETLEIKDMVQNVKMMINKEKDQLTMKLNPAHLGKLQIKLRKEGEAMIGEMQVDNQMAKDLLESKIGELRQTLEDQGMKIDRFSVMVDSESASGLAQQFSENSGSNKSGEGTQNAFSNKEAQVQTMDESTNKTRQSVLSEDQVSIYA